MTPVYNKRCLFCGINYVSSKAEHHKVKLTPEGQKDLKTKQGHITLLDCPRCGATNIENDLLNDRYQGKGSKHRLDKFKKKGK
jgi:hypothetical protein